MKHTALLLASVFGLTACGAPSVESLIENPEKLAEINQKCIMLMAQGKPTDTEECRNATKATQKMMENTINGIMGGKKAK